MPSFLPNKVNVFRDKQKSLKRSEPFNFYGKEYSIEWFSLGGCEIEKEERKMHDVNLTFDTGKPGSWGIGFEEARIDYIND